MSLGYLNKRHENLPVCEKYIGWISLWSTGTPFFLLRGEGKPFEMQGLLPFYTERCNITVF